MIYKKRNVLFGLDCARQAISKKDRVVIVEGYTDVMAAHLAGLESAVATLGTNLTQEHASLLRRFAVQGVSLLFDGDSAGLRAAERAYPALATELLSARICLMPEGLDPADLLSQDGRSGLDQVLAQGRDALDVYLSLLGGRLDLASHEGKMAAASSCREVLHGVADPLRRSDLLERMAAALFLPAQL